MRDKIAREIHQTWQFWVSEVWAVLPFRIRSRYHNLVGSWDSLSTYAKGPFRDTADKIIEVLDDEEDMELDQESVREEEA